MNVSIYMWILTIHIAALGRCFSSGKKERGNVKPHSLYAIVPGIRVPSWLIFEKKCEKTEVLYLFSLHLWCRDNMQLGPVLKYTPNCALFHLLAPLTGATRVPECLISSVDNSTHHPPDIFRSTAWSSTVYVCLFWDTCHQNWEGVRTWVTMLLLQYATLQGLQETLMQVCHVQYIFLTISYLYFIRGQTHFI